MLFPYSPYMLHVAHFILRDLIIGDLWGRVEFGKP